MSVALSVYVEQGRPQMHWRPALLHINRQGDRDDGRHTSCPCVGNTLPCSIRSRAPSTAEPQRKPKASRVEAAPGQSSDALPHHVVLALRGHQLDLALLRQRQPLHARQSDAAFQIQRRRLPRPEHACSHGDVVHVRQYGARALELRACRKQACARCSDRIMGPAGSGYGQYEKQQALIVVEIPGTAQQNKRCGKVHYWRAHERNVSTATHAKVE